MKRLAWPFLALLLVGVAGACSGSTTTIPGDDDSGSAADASSSSSGGSDGSTGSDGAAPGDATGDAQCQTSADCKAGGPDTCNICKAPLNHLVCASGACVCGCRVDAG